MPVYPTLARASDPITPPNDQTTTGSFYPLLTGNLTSTGAGLKENEKLQERDYSSILKDCHRERVQQYRTDLDRIFHPDKYVYRNKIIDVIEKIFFPWMFTFEKIDRAFHSFVEFCYGKEWLKTNKLLANSWDKLYSAHDVIKKLPSLRDDRVRNLFNEYSTKIVSIQEMTETVFQNINSETDMHDLIAESLRKETFEMTDRKITVILNDYEKACKKYLSNR